MNGDKKEKYLVAARIVVMMLALTGGAQVFLPGLGLDAPLSPGEAKTLIFTNNYFTVTFLKAVYDNSMPLYYLVAHVLAFLPYKIIVLRIFSFLCFLGTLKAAYELFKDSAENCDDQSGHPPATSLMVLFLGISPLLVYYTWRAEPFTFAALVITLAVLNFQLAYISRSADPSLFLKWTLIAAYTTHYTLFIFIACFFSVRRIERETGVRVRHRSTGIPLRWRFLFLFLPPVLIYVAGAIKPDSYLMGLVQLYHSMTVKSPELATGLEPGMFLPEAFVLAYVALLPAWIYFSLSRTYRKPAWKVRALSATGVLIVVCFASWAFYNSANRRITTNMEAELVFKATYSVATPEDGLLFIDTFEKDLRYLYEYYFAKSGMEYVIASPVNNRPRALDLGRGQPAPPPRRSKSSPEVIRIRELFMETESVWIIRGSLDLAWPSLEGDELFNSFFGWAADHTEMVFDHPAPGSAIFADPLFISEQLRLIPGIPREAQLLDMLITEYDDPDNAARLIQDDEFTPEMMGAFLLLDGMENIWERVLLLSRACGSNNSCRSRAMEKVLRFAAAKNSGAGGRALLQGVLDTYRKVLGGGDHKPNLEFKD